MGQSLSDLYEKHYALENRLNTSCDRRVNDSNTATNDRISVIMWRGVYAIGSSFILLGGMIIMSHLILDAQLDLVVKEDTAEVKAIRICVNDIEKHVATIATVISYSSSDY